MLIRDLGVLDGPVMLYGGPYSNLHATRAALDEADHRGIPCSHRICTGDTVAYGAHPAETVALIRARGGAVVAGNCERQLGAGAEGCGCGFDSGTTCDRLSAAWYGYATDRIGAVDRDWMQALPDMIVFTHHGARVAVIHGGVTDIARFLWPDTPEADFAREIAALEAATGPVDRIVAGHSGVPFERQVAGRMWLNAGAVGLPPHDGHPATRFAILEEGAARIVPLVYDTASAAAAMAAAGLTQGYHQALRSGWWPSEDVLPPALRRAS